MMIYVLLYKCATQGTMSKVPMLTTKK